MASEKSKKCWPGSIAATADRHEYYEKAVQAVDAEIDALDDMYRNIRGKRARIFREDFCGTANTSCEWVRRRKTNRAIGVDLDKEVLQWGRKHNINRLNEHQRGRISLHQCDVTKFDQQQADIIVAMNFSYQIFETRDSLRHYFECAREGLTDNGVFFIDAYGGYNSWRSCKEKTKYDGFKYYWDQATFDPITHHMLCHIHFKFPDGSWLKKAFTYAWRMWTLPELQELLDEAGFKNVTVYWEGTDEESGEGNGIYQPATEGDDDPAWICYLSGQK